jgi:hypothetical protein
MLVEFSEQYPNPLRPFHSVAISVLDDAGELILRHAVQHYGMEKMSLAAVDRAKKELRLHISKYLNVKKERPNWRWHLKHALIMLKLYRLSLYV